MRRFFQKPGRWAAVFSALLCGAVAFTLLDTFVIPKTYAAIPVSAAVAATVPQQAVAADAQPQSESQPVATATSCKDGQISIEVETVRAYDTTLYVADIQLADASLLKTALAGGVYGRNIKQTTSQMADENEAVFAINGDYYGFRDYGYVLRNGVLYRDISGGGQALVIDGNGDFSIAEEGVVSAQSLADAGAWQVLSFGPALVVDGQVSVDAGSEVDRAKQSNPRTAIGQVGPLHYIVVVSDGRTDESAGLSLLQLAQVMAERGAVTAYNLDGGGSSTMVLNGQVLNTTTGGRGTSEREVSDIVYIGY